LINKDFLSTISVLYVEDEDLAREKLCKLLTKLFKRVDTARNGKEGLDKFIEAKNSNSPYDLVISDINMPIMNGIVMLEKIRDIDIEVPFIFTTARSESENLLKAIALNANHYILKPIDLQDLIAKSQAVCEKDYFQRQLQEKQKEMENFLGAINNVAAVYIFNEDGEITYANESFLESIKYTQEELLGKKLEDIFHPEISKSIIPSIWDKIKSEETLETIIRYNNKDDESLYFSAAIFKLSGHNDEFISIGFESTEDVIQKKEFNKKVMKSFQEFNKKESNYKKEIQELKAKLMKFQSALVKLQKDLQAEKIRNQQKESQLAAYDSKALSSSGRTTDVLEQKSKEIQTHIKNNRLLKSKNEELDERVETLERELQKRGSELESLKERYQIKIKEIKELEKKR